MSKTIKRNFIVGGEWLYYKIYSGPKTADDILTKVIKPITELLLKEELIDKWFFIRYADPKNHIRLRLHVENPNYIGQILSEFHQSLEDFIYQDLVWRIQMDTYQREIERYGHNTMELSESVFFLDSFSIVEFLDMIEGDEGEKLRWLYGLRSIDNMLDCFNYNLEEKLSLLNWLKTVFGNEFGMRRSLKKQLDHKYRNERQSIEFFMDFKAEDKPDYFPILTNLSKKKESLRPVADGIIENLASNQPRLSLDNLMSSYIHMLMNRLFKSKNRLNEMVCYDFLYRYYKSLTAREVTAYTMEEKSTLKRG